MLACLPGAPSGRATSSFAWKPLGSTAETAYVGSSTHGRGGGGAGGAGGGGDGDEKKVSVHET